MQKKKVKKKIRRFKYETGERKNFLLNVRNNVKVKGSYLTFRFVHFPHGVFGNKNVDSLAIPFRFKSSFSIGDVVIFDLWGRTSLKSGTKTISKRKTRLYFKIVEIAQQEVWDGLIGPYTVVFLDVKELNNLEFLSNLNDLKIRNKKRGSK